MQTNKNPLSAFFIEMEHKWLASWGDNNIYRQYLDKNKKSDKYFSFQDGPITANNPMGVHHAWGRTYKDLWQRFHNLLGFRQRFQNGFDCQGLWVEVEVEKVRWYRYSCMFFLIYQLLGAVRIGRDYHVRRIS